MGLNLSSLQIAKELDMNNSDVRAMVQQLRQGIVDRQAPVVLSGEVEFDEVYTELPPSAASESALSNEKFNVLACCTSFAALYATN
jgi:hypothetical protein